jgi:hypothetical protein
MQTMTRSTFLFAGALLFMAASLIAHAQTTPPLQYVSLATPCRLVDTRPLYGGGGPIRGGTSRDFPVTQEGGCNIPATAAAYSLNVTVVPQVHLGYLIIWPTGQQRPGVSTLNSLDGRIKANAAIVAAGTGGAVSIYVTDTTNVVLDIDGYFVPAIDSALAFYPMTPCRVADTRQPGGGGLIPGGTTRNFPILGIPGCTVPFTAVAYSLNFTAVPPGTLGYLTAWPMGGARPNVSTLNDLTGTIVANAAIVGAGVGTGEISVYPSSATNLVIDIDGYFAPPGTDWHFMQ